MIMNSSVACWWIFKVGFSLCTCIGPQDVYVGSRSSADNAEIASRNIMLGFFLGGVRNAMDWVVRGLSFLTYPDAGE